MVASLTLSLSASARRALPFIERSVRTGMSSTALQSALAARGMGVRRTDLLDAIRHVRGVERRTNALASVRRDRKPDPSRIAIARTNIRRNFSFTVRVRGFDMVSGDLTERFVTITSDSVLSRQELEDAARAMLEEGVSNYPMDIKSVTLQKAVRRA